MIPPNLFPNRWYTERLKAKNRIKSLTKKAMENQTQQEKPPQQKDGKQHNPSWSHVQLWLMENEKRDLRIL